MAKQDGYTVVDLFCGAGGMSEGFKMSGYEILLGIEADHHAAETYIKNNPDAELIVNDIRNVSSRDIKTRLKGRKVDVVIGGPPCQGFSMANTRRRSDDPRNELYLEFVRIVKILKPKFFVMENVRGFLNVKVNNKAITKVISDLLKNYEVDGRVLVSSDYGVPQIRRRAFIIGRLGGGKPPFPKPTHFKSNNTKANELQKEWKTVKSILLPKSRVKKNLFYSERLIKGFRSRERKNKKNGIGFKWQFLDPQKPSYTIPARYYKDGANALVKYSNNSIRRLDVLECAKIQSFPNDYIFTGSKVQIYKQIGNAVPPLMANAIANNLKDEIKTK